MSRRYSEYCGKLISRGNGDRTIAKLGETLTGVSINKPLIRKKEMERAAAAAASAAAQGENINGRLSRSHLYAVAALW